MRVAPILIPLALAGALTVLAREPGPAVEASADGTPAYFVFLYATGADRPADRPLDELLGDARLQGHFAYMGRLSEEGTLVLGGPFKDLSGAMGVLRAADLDAARAIAEADPGVASGAFTVQAVKPWHPSVPGCVEDRPW